MKTLNSKRYQKLEEEENDNVYYFSKKHPAEKYLCVWPKYFPSIAKMRTYILL